MKLTKLVIAPRYAYRAIQEDNPLQAVVQLDDDKSTVECVLDEDTMIRILDLCAEEIANAAAERVAEFRNTVLAIDHGKVTALLDSE